MNDPIILSAEGREVKLTPDLCDRRLSLKDAILVIPGGGYSVICDDREGHPIAMAFAARGINAFVLKYSVGEQAVNYQPLIDASVAMAYLKRNADCFGISPDRISCVGFSAGGHLSASLGCLWHLPQVQTRAEIEYGENRPLVTVLGYPVISGVCSPHAGSFRKLCGKEMPTEEELRAFSLELHVDEKTAPAFIFHTSEDAVVPVRNALCYAGALADAGHPFELHVYPYGPHGLALANRVTERGNPAFIHPEAERWVDDAVRFINSI